MYNSALRLKSSNDSKDKASSLAPRVMKAAWASIAVSLILNDEVKGWSVETKDAKRVNYMLLALLLDSFVVLFTP